MKNLYIAFSFVIASSSVFAQSAATKKADKLYSRYEYVTAAEEYLKLVDNGKADNYVYKRLADTYFNMFNTVEAARWYAKATETTQDAETYYRYAQMLKSNGKYDEANKQMQKFASLAPNDQRAMAFKQDQIMFLNYLTNKKSMMLNHLKLVVTSQISEQYYMTINCILQVLEMNLKRNMVGTRNHF